MKQLISGRNLSLTVKGIVIANIQEASDGIRGSNPDYKHISISIE